MLFDDFARGPDGELDLLTGALLVARDAYPTLDLDVERERIHALAAGLVGTGVDRLSAREQARVLGDHLYEELGFQGNEDEYYDPRNSFLNDVVDRRLGIPITLAVVYVEVARRLGVRASGVGFPGHFLVRVEGPRGPVVVDPFYGGEVLERTTVERLWRKTVNRDEVLPDAALEPASVRDVVARMLSNLRGIYASRGELSQLLVVLDRIVTLRPTAARELRDRGLLQARLGAPRAAVADLERYLMIEPSAADADEVRGLVRRLLRSDAVLH